MPLVELLAKGLASGIIKITLILTENACFLINKDYLRVNLCYKIISLAELR